MFFLRKLDGNFNRKALNKFCRINFEILRIYRVFCNLSQLAGDIIKGLSANSKFNFDK